MPVVPTRVPRSARRLATALLLYGLDPYNITDGDERHLKALSKTKQRFDGPPKPAGKPQTMSDYEYSGLRRVTYAGDAVFIPCAKSAFGL